MTLKKYTPKPYYVIGCDVPKCWAEVVEDSGNNNDPDEMESLAEEKGWLRLEDGTHLCTKHRTERED